MSTATFDVIIIGEGIAEVWTAGAVRSGCSLNDAMAEATRVADNVAAHLK